MSLKCVHDEYREECETCALRRELDAARAEQYNLKNEIVILRTALNNRAFVIEGKEAELAALRLENSIFRSCVGEMAELIEPLTAWAKEAGKILREEEALSAPTPEPEAKATKEKPQGRMYDAYDCICVPDDENPFSGRSVCGVPCKIHAPKSDSDPSQNVEGEKP